MKDWWRLRRTVIKASPLLIPGDYRLYGDTARRLGRGPTQWLPDPSRLRLPGGAGESGSYDALIRRGRCLILLAADRRHVLRLYREPAYVARLVANTHWLRPSFPCPAQEPVPAGLDGWHGIREDFVSGCGLADAERVHWVPIYRDFLRCCAKHAGRRCEGYLDPSSWFSELDEWELPDDVAAILNYWRRELLQVLEDAPLLRSHGDPNNANLMVTDVGELAVIDVESVGKYPFFFDALFILGGSEPLNKYLRHKYFAGAFDDELNSIWNAAGKRFRPELRVAYLLASAFAQAFRPDFLYKRPERRRTKLIKVVERFADEIMSGKA